ncbi:MAG TPA: hypothetical protein VH594_16650 [Trebonia sp.]
MTAPADWQGFAEMTGGASGVLNAWYFLLPPRQGGSSPSGPA